jgi:uncharacterized SAM-binding protein YcdF (DUF218 family)
MFLLKKILAALILPPTGPVLLALFGLWLSRRRSRRWQHAGIALTVLSLASLLALSLPVVGDALMSSLEVHPPISREQIQRAQAIVVLGGGMYHGAPEYAGDTVSEASLERVRYAARLARESRLPLLVTSGAPFGGKPEGEAMRDVLEKEFGIKVRWVETDSRDTEENASLSAPMLKAAGISRIALVSHAWHLRRAVPLFQRQGIEVAPAPTMFSTASPSLLQDLLPGSLKRARQALNEYLGLAYYRLKEKLQ